MKTFLFLAIFTILSVSSIHAKVVNGNQLIKTGNPQMDKMIYDRFPNIDRSQPGY